MTVDKLIETLLELKQQGYGNKEVLYDYYGDIQDVGLDGFVGRDNTYINLCPVPNMYPIEDESGD